MASSATWVCSSLGRSNVDEMTSPLTVAAHVGDLFGPLVDEQHDELDLGVVDLDRRGDGLHHERLAGLGRRDDEPALALADRGDEVDDPRRHVGRIGRVLEAQLLVREQGREVLEPWAALGRFGVAPVDGAHLEQGRVLLVAGGRPAHAGDVVTPAQAVLAGQLDRDVGVVAAGEVPLDAHEAVALVAHVQVAADLDRLVADAILARLDVRGLRRRRPAVRRRHARRPCGGAGGAGCGPRRRRRRRCRLDPDPDPDPGDHPGGPHRPAGARADDPGGARRRRVARKGC